MNRLASSKGKHKQRPKQRHRETGDQGGLSERTRATDSQRLDDDAKTREQKLGDLMLSYHIQFEDDHQKGRIPASMLSAMTVLGLECYTEGAHIGRWRQNLLFRVKKLVQVAKRRELYGSEFKETTWGILENDILEHMRYDPTCKTCKCRWWKSDIVPEPVKVHGEGDGETEEAECECDAAQIGIDFSQLTSDSIMPANFYDAKVAKLLGGDAGRRNRMFGMLSSGFLAADVIELSRRDDLTSEGISSILPRPDNTQHSMLPFLVCIPELTGKDINTNVLQYQVAFAMHRALLSQQRVAVAAAASGATFEPLSWCLAYKNTDNSECALFAACLRTGRKHERDNPKRPPIRIVLIWRGELTSEDSALQLLRLVDYIAEWSNKVYHKDVARCFHYLVEQTDPEDSTSSETSATF